MTTTPTVATHESRPTIFIPVDVPYLGDFARGSRTNPLPVPPPIAGDYARGARKIHV